MHVLSMEQLTILHFVSEVAVTLRNPGTRITHLTQKRGYVEGKSYFKSIDVVGITLIETTGARASAPNEAVDGL